MAGRRQHYLPQFLQRGFTSDKNGKRTWLYLKESPPREVGIRDIGVEEQFYSDAGDRTLDESITKLETEEFSGLVQRIRTGSVGPISIPDDLPKIIAHLEVRTRHLRDVFAESGEKLWTITASELQAPGLLLQIFRKRYQAQPTALIEPARKQLGAMGLPLDHAETLAQQTANSLSTADDEFFAPFWATMLPILEKTLRPQLLQAAKRAHINALSRSIAPEIRAAQYRNLAFELVAAPSGNLPLGDSAVIFHVQGTRPFKPFLDKDDVILAVLLPLSPDRLLVGATPNYVVENETIRRQLARCSHKFFIASKHSQSAADLASSIGVAALPLTDEDLHGIVKQVIAELL